MADRTYDYPSKNTVRGEWYNFLSAMEIDALSVHGLYLPGWENNEIDGYCRLGYKPEQLIGCEHDPSMFPNVVRNAAGIRLHSGNISDAVSRIKAERLPMLAFANLDFDGIYDTYVEEILSLFNVFPTSKGGALAITSYSARDDDCLSQGSVNVSKFYAALGEEVHFLSDMGLMVDRWRDGKRLLASRVPDHCYLSRELGLLWWLVIVMMVVSYGKGGYGTIDRPFLKRIGACLDRLTKNVARTAKGKGIAFVSDDELCRLLSRRRVALWPTEFRHFIHYSQRSQPMRTWFFRLTPALHPAPTAQELVVQMWQLALRASLVYVDDRGSLVRFG